MLPTDRVWQCVELPGMSPGWVQGPSPLHVTLPSCMTQESQVPRQSGPVEGHGQAPRDQTQLSPWQEPLVIHDGYRFPHKWLLTCEESGAMTGI